MMVPRLDRRQILDLRGSKLVSMPARGSMVEKPFDVACEREPAGNGESVQALTIFLVGAECPFHCTMCDLWKYTLDGPTPEGSIPAQVEHALKHDEGSRWVKLYNASNFFDPRSVPEKDLPKIAQQVQSFERVVVENHPKFLRSSIEAFRKEIPGRLEIAMGLETIHAASFSRLNKQFSLDEFHRACEWLLDRDIDLRAFIMLQPPETASEESIEWAVRSLEFAFACGARCASVIPSRLGNGAMELLQANKLFQAPSASQLEETLRLALDHFPHKITTADLWDWENLNGTCSDCSQARRSRMERMNELQKVEPMMACDACSKTRLR